MSLTRRWGVGAAIAALVILAAGWFLLVKPQKSKASDLRTQTATQEQANQLLTTKIQALQAQQKQLPQQQQILEKFATKIPESASQPSLIRALTTTAKASGVDLASITPGAAAPVDAAAGGTATLGAAAPAAATLYSMPIALSVTGSYANLESFFSGLEQLPRAFLVSGFGLTPGGTSNTGEVAANALTATITTAVFYAPGTAPIPVVTPPAATSSAATPAPASTDAAGATADAKDAAHDAARQPS
jgi:Tfp pilus assembly protein PilO